MAASLSSSTAAKRASLASNIQEVDSVEDLAPFIKAIGLARVQNQMMQLVNGACDGYIEGIHRRSLSILSAISEDALQCVLSFLSVHELPDICVLSKAVSAICKTMVRREMLLERWLVANRMFRHMFEEAWLNVDAHTLYTHQCDMSVTMPTDIFPMVYFLVERYPLNETPELRGADAVIMRACNKFNFAVTKVIYADACICHENPGWEPRHFCSEVSVEEGKAEFAYDRIGRWRYSNAEWDYARIPTYRNAAFYRVPEPWRSISRWDKHYDIARAMFISGPTADWRRDLLRRLKNVNSV